MTLAIRGARTKIEAMTSSEFKMTMTIPMRHKSISAAKKIVIMRVCFAIRGLIFFWRTSNLDGDCGLDIIREMKEQSMYQNPKIRVVPAMEKQTERTKMVANVIEMAL